MNKTFRSSKDEYDHYVSQDKKVNDALELIMEWGGIDGSHHKQWLLDQLVRALSNDYNEWVATYCDGEDGENTYFWDKGIAP